MLGWVGVWFFMSDASTRLSDWANGKVMAVTANHGFQVENILVEGRRYTDVDALRAIINVDKGDSIFLFDPAAAKEMIEKISWVKSAQIERRLPDTIYIGLQERTPMALWQRHKRLSLIDTDGVVLSDHKLEPFQEFIVVVGEEVPSEAPGFLRLLTAEPLIFDKVEAATLVSGRRWDLTLKSGAVVKLPEEDTTVALRRLAVMQEEEKLMEKDINVIDVREPTRITVQTKPGAVQEYKTGFQAAADDAGGAI